MDEKAILLEILSQLPTSSQTLLTNPKIKGKVNWRKTELWDAKKHISTWYGVNVGKNGSVIELHLGGLAIVGEMPESIFKLSSLKV